MVDTSINLNILIRAQNMSSSVLDQLVGGLGKVPPIAVAAGAAVIGIGIALGIAVKKAADFQTGLTVLSTGAGESAANLKMVGDGILQISVDTATSTDQLLKGMFMIESAGYRGQDGLNVLRVAAQGARLENADLGQTAFAVTGILHDYGMKSTEAAQAMNALIVTESSGKMHMQDLTTTLGRVLPLASSLNVAYPQIGAAIAVMTNANMTARNAANNLAFALRALAAPSGVAMKAMASVGINAQALHDTLTHQGLQAALQMVEEHVGKTFPDGSVKAVQAFKAILGGASGYNVALMLGGKHMKEYQTDIANITKAMNDGKTGVMGWDQVQGTFNFRLQQAKEALNAMFIEIGMKLLPVLTNIAAAITPVITQIAQWIIKQDILGKAIAFFTTVFQTVGVAMSVIFPIFMQIMGLFGQLVSWVQKNKDAMEAFKVIAIALGVVIAGVLTAALIVIVAVLAVVAVAIALVVRVVMAIIWVFQHWGDMANWLGNVISTVVASIGSNFSRMASLIQGVFAFIVAVVSNAWNYIVNYTRYVWSQITNAVWTGMRNIWNTIQGMAGNILNILIWPFQAAIGHISGIMGNIANMISNITNMASGIHIPGFASGVQNFGGGLAIVGERGPELVSLPRGSGVSPHGTGPSGGATINVSINTMAGSRSEINRMVDMLEAEIGTRFRGQTPGFGFGA